ncbi:hypothetical protein P280DRAFT_128462 [Massarina eburnea CBS 473.64]|uniref:Secreted protein n=1 Tax=Massarina eburnea CBS 473.64 TaxID=1395130 RepID=A0A6A6SCY7_9PLEO|nr:hypothetical protein P280DRAFT_128462 [Massarina eburnea CBS 473.64]
MLSLPLLLLLLARRPFAPSAACHLPQSRPPAPPVFSDATSAHPLSLDSVRVGHLESTPRDFWTAAVDLAQPREIVSGQPCTRTSRTNDHRYVLQSSTPRGLARTSLTWPARARHWMGVAQEDVPHFPSPPTQHSHARPSRPSSLLPPPLVPLVPLMCPHSIAVLTAHPQHLEFCAAACYYSHYYPCPGWPNLRRLRVTIALSAHQTSS